MRQSVALPQDIINFVHFPFPPPWRQAGAHRGHAGWLARFECRVSPGVVAHEAAGLSREIVEGADERVEALAEMGGVKGGVRGFEG